jgi:hypothetical protein
MLLRKLAAVGLKRRGTFPVFGAGKGAPPISLQKVKLDEDEA